MLRQAVFIAQPDRRVRLKKISDQLQNSRERLAEVMTRGQCARQPIQSRGTFFATALGLFAFVQLRCQVPDDNSDDEISAEHHEVFEFADVKSEAWRDEKEVPE